MVMNTASIHNAVANTTSASVGNTFKSVNGWMGRTCSKGAQTFKEICRKIGSAIVDFFRNFPKYIRSGYGIGVLSGLVGTGLLITSICLKKNEHHLARTLLMIAAAAFFVLAGLVIAAFRGNPVTFARPSVAIA